MADESQQFTVTALYGLAVRVTVGDQGHRLTVADARALADALRAAARLTVEAEKERPKQHGDQALAVRNRTIWERAAAGATFVSLAAEFGLSSARVAQIYRHEEKMRPRWAADAARDGTPIGPLTVIGLDNTPE